jgi:ubiquinone/menaquinone biosynthesis C-methylase UbiE
MGFHTFDSDRAAQLDDESRFRFCSREELLQFLPREGTVADLGSGTGFYTDELAPHVGDIVGLDVQAEMHHHHMDNGVSDNVALVTGNAESLPFADSSLAGAFSTMTFHESTSPNALADLQRALVPGGPFVAVDWSAEGDGERGPPRGERFDVARARELLVDAGFTIDIAGERSETFLVVARA